MDWQELIHQADQGRDLRRVCKKDSPHFGKVVEVIGGAGYTVYIKFSPHGKDYNFNRLHLERLTDEEKSQIEWK